MYSRKRPVLGQRRISQRSIVMNPYIASHAGQLRSTELRQHHRHQEREQHHRVVLCPSDSTSHDAVSSTPEDVCSQNSGSASR